MPDPLVSAGPSVGPAPTGGHLEVIVVPAPSPPSANKRKEIFSISFHLSLVQRLNSIEISAHFLRVH